MLCISIFSPLKIVIQSIYTKQMYNLSPHTMTVFFVDVGGLNILSPFCHRSLSFVTAGGPKGKYNHLVPYQIRYLRRRRRWWVSPWLLCRPLNGYSDRLMQEMRREDVQSFQNFLRIDPKMFQEHVERLSLRLERQETIMHKSLEPGLRVAVTSFRVASNTIGKLVREVLPAIIEEYGQEVIVCSTMPEEWFPIAVWRAVEFSTCCWCFRW